MWTFVEFVLSLTPWVWFDVGHVNLYVHQNLLNVLGGFVLTLKNGGVETLMNRVGGESFIDNTNRT